MLSNGTLACTVNCLVLILIRKGYFQTSELQPHVLTDQHEIWHEDEIQTTYVKGIFIFLPFQNVYLQ